jgi:short-subunit dehydrogenase
MIERNKKFNKKSGIINLSSAAAQSSLSYSSHYCATKAYDDLLTSSVANEYRN